MGRHERNNMTRTNLDAQTLVVADGGVLPVANLSNTDNYRAFAHQIVPVIVTMLVTMNVVTDNTATAWVSFVFAIADNLLSVGNTTDRVRRAIYAGVGVLQAGGLLTTLLTDVAPTYVPVASAALAIVSATLSRFYTPTSTLTPREDLYRVFPPQA